MKLEQTIEKQDVPIEPESFFKKINPYYGSRKYVMAYKEVSTRAIFETMALLLAPGSFYYGLSCMKKKNQ
jgi:hypothetical protein